jgi:hypothetical protein
VEVPERFTFHAILPGIQSAISISGTGDGARLKLDIPASDAVVALLLAKWGSNRVLRVTVEPLYEGLPRPEPGEWHVLMTGGESLD